MGALCRLKTTAAGGWFRQPGGMGCIGGKFPSNLRLMDDALQFERREGVGILTLNRPERLNALNHGMVRDLRTFFDERELDYDTRVLIVTGAGRGFCAGLDLKAQGEQGPWKEGIGAVQDSYAFQESIADIVVKMRKVPQPIIAAVNGPATGGGFSIALASDMRIATPAARFACSFLNLGLGGGDMGTSYFLPRLVGSAHAADLLYSGRLIDADEALRMGIVTRIVDQVDLLDTACEMARAIIRRASPLGLRLTKEVLNETVSGISLEAALKLENRNQILAGQTADSAESLRAWFEKRDPQWRDA
ncbi:MAG: enoyl-CoA hydratase/isomerase family protein [Dehalococcoidia bacterium]